MPDEPFANEPELTEPQPEESHSQVNAGVAKAGGIMVFSLLMSRVLGIFRDIIITYIFGINAHMDAYRLAFMLPDVLFYLISGGALSSAFIPVFTEYWHTGRQKEAWKVFSGVMCTISLILLLFILACGVFADPLYRYFLARGLQDKSLIPEIVSMSRILLPAQFAFFIGGLMMGTLYVRRVFAIPGLAPNIYNIGIIFGAVVLSRFVSQPLQGMCWGAAGGAILGNLLIPFLQIRKLGMELHFKFFLEHEGVRKVFKLMLPVILGLSLPAVFGMIMQGFATYFPRGTNSILDLSTKLMQAPLGIFGQSLAIAVFPVLTQFYAQGKMDMFKSQLDRTMRTVIYITVPVSVLMAVLAPQLSVGLYLSRKVPIEQTEQIAVCLQIFCIGIWAWCLHPVLMRAFYSIHDTKTPVIIGTVTTAVFVGLLMVLMKTPLSYKALPLAGSIAPMLMVMAMCAVVSKKLGGFDYVGVFRTLGKALVGSISVALVCALLAWTPLLDYLMNHGPFAHQVWWHKVATLLMVLIGFCIAMWVYYFVTKAMKMPESEYFDRMMKRLERKRAAG
ncbi:MAG: murein biosynthesis integral membrane protein MurJ [Armatimonadetes bacterium]|nr:murein biosynthesis integral membrane protein MurJ [Armatimonadota bacterium]